MGLLTCWKPIMKDYSFKFTLHTSSKFESLNFFYQPYNVYMPSDGSHVEQLCQILSHFHKFTMKISSYIHDDFGSLTIDGSLFQPKKIKLYIKLFI